MNPLRRTLLKIFPTFPFLFSSKKSEARTIKPIYPNYVISGEPAGLFYYKRIDDMLSLSVKDFFKQLKNNENEPLVEAYLKFIESVKNLEPFEQCRELQIFLNDRRNFGYVKDTNEFPKNWQTPIDSLVRRKGDCEDSVILKYMTLLNFGFSRDKLFFVIGEDMTNRGIRHMVLVVKINENSFVLDNKITKKGKEVITTKFHQSMFIPFNFINLNSKWQWILRYQPNIELASKTN